MLCQACVTLQCHSIFCTANTYIVRSTSYSARYLVFFADYVARLSNANAGDEGFYTCAIYGSAGSNDGIVSNFYLTVNGKLSVTWMSMCSVLYLFIVRLCFQVTCLQSLCQ